MSLAVEAGPRPQVGAVAAEPGDEGPGYKWTVLLVTGSGIYMSTLSNGIVNVALPVLTREFDAPLVLAQWVVLAYILCITGLLLPSGRLADMLGRKKVFLTGFVVFAAGAALCGLAPSLPWLIAARVLQGLGGALVQANSGALVALAFPPTERGRALGMIGSCVSAGALSGPMIGGVITAYLGWRWAFYVVVLVSGVATPAGWRLLRRSPVSQGQRFDPAGAALFMLAVGSLMLALNRGPLSGWASVGTLALFGLSLAAAAAFVWVERRVAQPTVDLRLFRNRGFAAAVGAGFLSFLAISTTVLLMPFYFQYVLRLPPDQAGVLMAASSFTMMLLAPVSGWLSDRVGSRRITAVGLGLEVLALGSLALLSAHEHPLWAAARLVLLGLALALFNSPNSSAMYGAVPPARLGLVGGFQALTRNLGQSLGQTGAGVLWSVGALAAARAAGVAAEAAAQAPPEAMMAGFRLAFGWATAVAAAALVVSLVARPHSRQVPQSEVRSPKSRRSLPEEGSGGDVRPQIADFGPRMGRCGAAAGAGRYPMRRMRIATYERPPTRRGLLRGALLAGGAAAAGAAALAGRTAGPLRFPTRGPAGPLVPPTPDHALVHEKLALARAERLHALPPGERVVRLGQTFAGTAYVAATLEAPGAEHLVVNLRELDCVTFVECTLALARVAHSRGGKSGGTAEEYQAFTAELRRLRYRNGEIAGYASRLHYFSDWIADNARKGIVRDISRDLGGVEDARPVTFMSAHPKDYRQLAEPEHLEAIRRVEAALNARPRFHVPADRLLAALPQIRNGDVLAATTSIEGLDIAHTALAIWRDGDLHLLHAPSVGGAVQVSRVPVPEWMRLNRQHTGLMVARPV